MRPTARNGTEWKEGASVLRQQESGVAGFMNVLDLIKATIACGLSAFLIYSFAVVGQVIIIGVLSLVWLSYAHRTLAAIRRR